MPKRLHSREYWKQIVQEIELRAQLKRRNEELRNTDYSVALPTDLRKRVAKILPYEFDDYDRLVYIDTTSVETPKSFGSDDESEVNEERKKERKKAFNESTCSEIERLENEFRKFDVKFDTPLERKHKAKKKVFWGSRYVCRPRKERVVWNSKIYQLESHVWEKTLDEQAADLMDASAERFSEWINELGSNHESDITKERIKSLFSIEGDRRLLSSIQTDPKEVKAIAKTVADKWNLQEMAIETKYERYIQKRLENVPKELQITAFGLTIPYRDRPWMPSSRDTPIVTIFPEELLTRQKLFKGIGKLRSTKALIDFYQRNPSFERPQYLVKAGMFNVKAKATTKQEIPLYERLKLTYS